MMIRWNNLRKLIGEKDVAFTIYTPDAIRGNWVQYLDSFIRDGTALQSGDRYWIEHSEDSACEFYGTTLPTSIRCYVEYLLKSGLSLLTVWRGPHPYKTLNLIKGKTHPAAASPKSVRGALWCDNRVTNLIHVSDDHEDAAQEINSLQRNNATILECSSSSFFAVQSKESKVTHAGIFILARALFGTNTLSPSYVMASHSIWRSSSEAFYGMKRYLLQDSDFETKHSAVIVDAYFNSNFKEFSSLVPFLSLSSWDRFVLECSMNGLREWREREVRNVIEVVSKLIGDEGWLVGGSAALFLYGIDIKPNDIDVRCDLRVLRAARDHFGSAIQREDYTDYCADVVKTIIDDWNVEFVGNLYLSNGVTASVDSDMFACSKINHLQSIEDIVCEYSMMKRHDEKKDSSKISQVLTKFGNEIDLQYIRERARRWNLDLTNVGI